MPFGCQMCQMKMQQLENMAKLKESLAQAKDAAQTEGAKNTLAKINEVQNLLEQQHQTIHKEMSQHMQKMHQDMKCPLCDKMAKSNEELSQHMETMHQGMKCPMCGKSLWMGKSEQSKAINK